MRVTYNVKNITHNLEFDKLCILFGPNNTGKTESVTSINKYLESGSKDILINSSKVQKGEINTIYFSEDTDFTNEFKFTKTNVFRSILYDDVLKKINEEKILTEINNLFDVIDNKVNKYIHSKLSKLKIDELYFDTNLTDVSKIIDKFTDIYFNEFLLSSNNIPKHIKRFLIYQLLFLYLDNDIDKKTFVIIDNFDVYLDNETTIEVLNLLSKYSEKYDNVYFIITTNKNVYPYLNENYTVYKMNTNNVLKNINTNYLIKEFIQYKNYKDSNSKLDFSLFKTNENLPISTEEINDIKNNLYMKSKDKIGTILINSDTEIIRHLKFNSKVTKPYILAYDKDEQLFLEIIQKSLTLQ